MSRSVQAATAAGSAQAAAIAATRNGIRARQPSVTPATTSAVAAAEAVTSGGVGAPMLRIRPGRAAH